MRCRNKKINQFKCGEEDIDVAKIKIRKEKKKRGVFFFQAEDGIRDKGM